MPAGNPPPHAMPMTSGNGGQMHYNRFEQIVLLVGAAIFLGSLGIALLGGGTTTAEIVAQLLLLLTLAAAVHWGARGGLIGAVVASAIYLGFWISALPVGTIPPAAYLVLVSRLVAFGLVGVVAGELCGRLKYALAKVAGLPAIDDWSRVYNQRYVREALLQAKGRFDRYGEPVSLVEVRLSPSLVAGMRPARQRSFVRAVAEGIRTDVRMVDDVGRLDDGRFIVILPHTPPEGGRVVMDRLANAVCRTTGAGTDAVTLRCIGLPGDGPAFDGLISAITPAEGQEPASEA